MLRRFCDLLMLVDRVVDMMGSLGGLACMILGEIHFAQGHWRDAAASYRFLLGDLDHALYPFTLWRTAAVHGAQDEQEQRTEILEQLVQLGCATDAPEHLRAITDAAAFESGARTVAGRYETCRDGAPQTDIENELPPGYN